MAPAPGGGSGTRRSDLGRAGPSAQVPAQNISALPGGRPRRGPYPLWVMSGPYGLRDGDEHSAGAAGGAAVRGLRHVAAAFGTFDGAAPGRRPAGRGLAARPGSAWTDAPRGPGSAART